MTNFAQEHGARSLIVHFRCTVLLSVLYFYTSMALENIGYTE